MNKADTEIRVAELQAGAPTPSRIITLDGYTAKWSVAIRLRNVDIGTRVAWHDSADAREVNDFQTCLARQNKELRFVDADDEPGVDIFEVTEATDGEVAS